MHVSFRKKVLQYFLLTLLVVIIGSVFVSSKAFADVCGEDQGIAGCSSGEICGAVVDVCLGANGYAPSSNTFCASWHLNTPGICYHKITPSPTPKPTPTPTPNLTTCEKAGGGACSGSNGPNPICTTFKQPTTVIATYTSSNGICGPTEKYCILCGKPSLAGAPTSSCGAGNNNGSDNATCGKDNNLWYCYQNQWHPKSTCSNGCQVNSGAPDTCKGTSTGSGGPGTSGGGSGTTTTSSSSSSCVATIDKTSVKIIPNSNATSISATVTAGNAQRVDATITAVDSATKQTFSINKTGKTAGGVICKGTTCSVTVVLNQAFPKITVGHTYAITVTFNSWNICGSSVNAVQAKGSTTLKYGNTTNGGNTCVNGKCSQTGDACTTNNDCIVKPTVTPIPCSSAQSCPSGQVCLPSHLCGAPATANITIQLQGIDGLNNTRPHQLTRKITIYLYKDSSYTTDPSGHLATYKATGTVTFVPITSTNQNDPTAGSFTNGQFPLGAITTGNYFVLMKSAEGSLRTLLSPSPIPITAGKNNVLVDTSASNATITIPQLPMGDLNGDNVIDINDYAILLDCYGNKMNSSTCINHHLGDEIIKNVADINNDGVVDGIDYNILIRNFNTNGY